MKFSKSGADVEARGENTHQQGHNGLAYPARNTKGQQVNAGENNLGQEEMPVQMLKKGDFKDLSLIGLDVDSWAKFKANLKKITSIMTLGIAQQILEKQKQNKDTLTAIQLIMRRKAVLRGGPKQKDLVSHLFGVDEPGPPEEVKRPRPVSKNVSPQVASSVVSKFKKQMKEVEGDLEELTTADPILVSKTVLESMSFDVEMQTGGFISGDNTVAEVKSETDEEAAQGLMTTRNLESNRGIYLAWLSTNPKNLAPLNAHPFRGIARALITPLFAKADAKNLSVKVKPDGPVAKAVYLRMGFMAVDGVPDLWYPSKSMRALIASNQDKRAELLKIEQKYGDGIIKTNTEYKEAVTAVLEESS